MQISVQGDLKSVTRGLKQFRKQIPFATSKALNNTANKVRDELEDHTRQVFKAPVKFTQKPVVIEYSNKRKLWATIVLKQIQHKYLDAEIKGGPRKVKPYERKLRSMGVLPSNSYTVPAKGIRLNKFGNLTKAAVRKMITGLQTHHGKYFKAEIRGAKGIWERHGKNRIRLYMLFVEVPRYAKTFRYRPVTFKVVRQQFSRQFTKAFNFAVKTAR